MTLHLYDTLSAKVQALTPIDPGHVKLYVCGPTVYDYAHVGHMRSALTYDFLVRHLRERGLRVRYVRNVTDVDDKILKRAAERNESPETLARRFEGAYQEDVARLGLLAPDAEPRVSEHLPSILALIERLIAKEAAYASQGDVYFNVSAFAEYGKLSHRKQADLDYGASGRLDDEEVQRKRHPADFALWKAAKSGEVSWDSPWGKGRPGWHIECSAMGMQQLGDSFDIHGGGLDLVFPHHENEIAQSEAATGKPYVRIWMHHGFIETSREKMSKSLGNFLTARDCFRLFEPEALRYLMLTTHYRAPLALDWSVDESGTITGCPQLEETERRAETIYRTRIRLAAIEPLRITDAGEVAEPLLKLGDDLRAALDDDLNLPIALAVVAEFLKQVNELSERTKVKKATVSQRGVQAANAGFALLERLLGLGSDDPQAWLHRVRKRRTERLGLREEEIEQKIAERVAARGARDFARADALRDEMAARGVELMDGAGGTSWRIP